MCTVVPLVFWGSEPPSHFVTCVTICPTGQEVATGCRSGFICLWTLHYHEFHTESTDHSSGQQIPPVNTYQAQAKSLLIGASEEISCLCYSQDGSILFSASRNGDIYRWDAKDGACTHQTNLKGEHKGLRYLGQPQPHPLLLVYGNYCSAYLLNARTLDLAIVLRSEERPNWISSMLAIPLSLQHKDTPLLGITTEQLVKIWDVPRLDLQFPRDCDSKEEDKSRHTDLTNVQQLKHWPRLIAQRLLVVGISYFKVLGVRARSQLPELCHVDCVCHVYSLSGGDFVDDEHIVVWSRMGSAHLYSFLPTGHEEKFEARHLRRFQTQGSIPMDASWDLLHQEGKVLLVQGNANGALLLWEVDLELGDRGVASKSPPEKTPPHYKTSLHRSWDLLDNQSGMTSYLREALLSHTPLTPSHIPDDVNILESSWLERDADFAKRIQITALLHLPELSKVMCGLSNGYVVVFPLVRGLEQIVFGSALDSACDDVIVMKAHRGRVSALLYPCQYSEQFNRKYVMTGGADGAVRVWDIENRLHLHCFLEHVGEVSRLKVCPNKMTNTRLNCGVCSVGQDNSVAILSLSEFREVLLCGNHSAEITHVRWKPAEDLMLVRCKDGRVYIWQMDTGVLDRVIVGHLAEDIISTSYSGGSSSYGQKRDSLVPKSSKGGVNGKSIASFKTYKSQLADITVPTLLIHMEPLIEQLHSSEQALTHSSVSQTHPSRSQDLSDLSDLSTSPTRPSPYERKQETVFFTRFLISCLHSWGMDAKLDTSCQDHLRLRQPLSFGMSPQFGLLSKYSCVSVYLPGWGLERSSLSEPAPSSLQRFPLSHKWCLSPGLTTQHLLALTTLSYCCMNLYSKKQKASLSDESSQRKLTTCSQLNTLTCVFLPEMLGRNFTPPHLSVLALKWPHSNGQIREAAQALLLAQLRNFSLADLQETVAYWYQHMPPPPSSPRGGVKGLTYGNKDPAGAKRQERRPIKMDLNDFLNKPEALIKAKEYFTSLIIVSVIAAEFTESSLEFRHSANETPRPELLSPQEMEHLALCLQGILCCPQSSSCSLQGSLRRTAAELMANGFNFFCKYLDVPSILMALFEITVTQPVNTGVVEEPLSADYQLARNFTMRALTNIFQTRPDEMIDVLAREVSSYTQFIGSSHSLIPVPGYEYQEPEIAAGVSKSGMHLLPRARKILLKILEELLKKRLPHVLLKIVEFMALAIFCVGSDELRTRRIEEAFPSVDKLGCYAHCVKMGNLAVGRKSGFIGLFDLKHNKLQEFSGHMSPVTCLTFSVDGKYLCSYSQGSSEIRLWHVSTPLPILGQMVNPTVKLVKTIMATTPQDNQPIPPNSGQNNFRLFWLPKSKGAVLLMGDNPKTEIEFSF